MKSQSNGIIHNNPAFIAVDINGLRNIVWLSNSNFRILKINPINGVSRDDQDVSYELKHVVIWQLF